jgi:hypothetical protein
MKLLLAVDSTTTLEILLDAMMARSWPVGTQARVLSIVEDGEVPLEKVTALQPCGRSYSGEANRLPL